MARARKLLDKTELQGIGREVGYADPLHSPASSAARTASGRAAIGSIARAERADVRAGSGQRLPTMSRSTANPTMVEHRSRDSDREPGGSR
jgi:hypothetical protein